MVTLQHIQEISAQAAQAEPLFLREGLSQAADQYHKDWDERCGKEQHQASNEVKREDENQEGQGYHGSQCELRQVLAEISIEGFDAFHYGVRQLTGTLARSKGRTEGCDMGKKPPSQVAFDSSGNVVSGNLPTPGETGAAAKLRPTTGRATPNYLEEFLL